MRFCFFVLLFSVLTMSFDVRAELSQSQHYQNLLTDLRCLVCQNQNLADSDAPLAQDLRKKIAGLLQQGKSEDEIKSYLVDLYGDFILFKPALKKNTLLLWFGPFLFLLLGLIVFLRNFEKVHGTNSSF